MSDAARFIPGNCPVENLFGMKARPETIRHDIAGLVTFGSEAMNQPGIVRKGGSAEGWSRSELWAADDIESSFAVKLLEVPEYTGTGGKDNLSAS
ncbi:MAG: hypothetical protein ABJC09_13895 [Terriglobia bacterium]